MKILKTSNYNYLISKIKELTAENEQLKKQNKILKNDKNILLNILNPDILGLDFPNTTEERGFTGDTGTPIDNLPDIFNLWINKERTF